MQKQIVLFKLLLCLLFIVMIKTNSYAQTGLNFQGVARSSNNVIIASQQISLRLSILQGTATGSVEYSETRKVTTNAQGLFAVVIGDADATSAMGSFNTINWKNTPKFLKIEMDANAGNNYTTIGTTQFQYVAYAQFASSVDAENIAGIVPVNKGGTGVSSITALRTSLALDKINNTADADKPISIKTQAALDLISVTASDTSRFSSRINTKANTVDVNTSLALKANTSDVATSLTSKLNKTDTSYLLQKADTISLSNRIDLKSNTSDVNVSLAIKANESDVTTSLASKLNKTDTSYLLQKADTTTLSNRINLKANVSDVNTGLTTKVDKVTGKVLSTNDYTSAEKTKLAAITGTNTGDQDLSSYATNTSLALKANTSDINTSLALKASISDVTISLDSKENISNKSAAADLGGVSPSDVLFPTQKAVKDYVAANAGSGGVADGGITNIKLAEGAVTYSKFQSIPTNSILGNTSSSTTSVQAIATTGSDNVVLSTSPTITSPILITPNIGVATATSINDVIIYGFNFKSDVPSITITGTTSLQGNNTGDNATNTKYEGLLTYGAVDLITDQAIDGKKTFLNDITMANLLGAGSITPTTINFANGSKIGDIQNIDDEDPDIDGSIDLFAPDGAKWVQMNYGNANYIWLNNDIARIGIGNMDWTFDKDGSTGFPVGLKIQKDEGTPEIISDHEIAITSKDYLRLRFDDNGSYTRLGIYKDEAELYIYNDDFSSTWNYKVDGSSWFPGDLNFTDNHAINFTSTGTSTTTTNASITSTGPLFKIQTREVTETEYDGDYNYGIELNYADRNHLDLREYMYFLNQDDDVSNENYLSSVTFNYDIFNFLINNNGSYYQWQFKDDGSTLLPGALLLTGNIETTGTLKLGSTTFTNQPASNGYVLTADASGNAVWQAPTATGVSDNIDASTLSGTTLNSTITGSSLTSVGVLNSATVNGKVIVGATSEVSVSAVLEASSTTQGFLPPRMTIAQRSVIASPAQGLMIYCTNCGSYGEPQYYNGSAWLNFAGIASAKATSTITLTIGTYTYTGSAQGPNEATNTGTGTSYTYSYAGTGSTTYSSSATLATNAGTYSVTVTLAASSDGNYNSSSSSAEFTIAKAIPTVTATIGTYTYTGSAQGPNEATNTGTGTSYTYSYAGTGSTTYSSSATLATNAGTYSVTVTLAASSDGNYNSSSSSAEFTIAKAIPTVTATIGTYTYTGSALGPSEAINTGTGTTYTYSYSGTGSTTYGPSATKPIDEGNYTVIATVSANGNYATGSSSATAFRISTNFSVGVNYQGGIIAYIFVSGDPGYDATTPHGLIVATADQSAGIQWYNGSFIIVGSMQTEIGSGLANTNLIISKQGATSTSYAAGLARAYKGGGYADWYLPSSSELLKLYVMKVLGFGGFANKGYWSSTESSSLYFGYAALSLDLGNGGADNFEKDAIKNVRAIRAF